jgi:predicted RNA-binding protein associated with RNAse of E/G family
MSTNNTTLTVALDVADRLREIANREGFIVKALAEKAIARGLDEIEAEIKRGREETPKRKAS